MKKIKLYSLPTCVSCTILKEELKKKKIDYQLVDNMDDLRRSGILAVPQLEIWLEASVIDGLEPLEFRRVLNFSESISWLRGGID